MTDEIENLRQQQFVSLPFPDTEEARRAVIREEARRAAITNQWKEFYGELTYSIKTPAFAFIRYNPERPNQLMLSAVQKWLKRIVKLVPAMFLVFQGGVIIKWAYIGGAVDWGFLSWVSSLVFILLIVVIVWRWLGAIDYGLTEIKETVLNIATLANATMRLDWVVSRWAGHVEYFRGLRAEAPTRALSHRQFVSGRVASPIFAGTS